MASILIVTNGLPGLLYSSLELARRLSAAGHELTYASFPEARETVETHGADFLELAPSRYDGFLEADRRSGLLHRLLNLGPRREQAVAAAQVGGFVEAVRDLAPDLVLIDLELHEHIVAIAGTGVPLALLNTFVSIWRQPGVAPPHRLVRPGVGWKGSRVVAALLWRELRLKKLRRAWGHRLTRVGCDRLSVIGRLARDAGFDLRRETDPSPWPIPFTYRHLPVLTLHAREFEFDPEVPERVRYVGPMVPPERPDRRATPEDEAAIGALLERRRSEATPRPLVYAGFGSFFTTNLDFVRRLVEGLARGEGEVVLSLGGRLPPSAVGPLPPRVHAFSWVPQLRVLRHADVSVNHGAINTVDECVLCGVPMLAYCGFETDMPGTTARLVHHGLGIAGDRQRDTPATIRGHVDRLLHEPHFRETVARFRTAYARYAEEQVAERVVDALLDRGDDPGPGGPGA
jgi:UDP:flavonoid glycosyltransferase YjiC (YdhE family)